MTNSPTGDDMRPSSPSNLSTQPAPIARGRTAFVVIAAAMFALAAVLGAYLNWMWWVVSYGGGLLITLAGGILLLAGLIVAMIGRGIGRRIALIALAVGAGLLAGQNLGPDREPLVGPVEGTLTLRLTSPTVAVATGSAFCTNVASATEFQVSGDPNIRLDTPDQPFVSINVNVGDRWRVLRETPRKDGVLLRIDVTGAQVSASGKPGTIGMMATGSSTVESIFSNEGGSIRFAGLVGQVGPDFTGESMDLAGTLEWTCEAATGLSSLQSAAATAMGYR